MNATDIWCRLSGGTLVGIMVQRPVGCARALYLGSCLRKGNLGSSQVRKEKKTYFLLLDCGAYTHMPHFGSRFARDAFAPAVSGRGESKNKLTAF